MKAVRSLLAALSALALVACGGGSIKAPDFEAALKSLVLSVPANQATPALGQTVQLTLMGAYTCQPSVACPSTADTPITEATYTVGASSDGTASTGKADIDNTGLVTTTGTGTLYITASKDGIKSAPITLIVGPAALTSVVVRVPNTDGSASSASAASVAIGGTKDFKVYGVYSNNPAPVELGSSDYTSITWNVATAGIATLAPNNTVKTTVTGVATGESDITAVVNLSVGGNKTGTGHVSVGGASIVSFRTTLDPATASIAQGDTQQFKIVATFSDGTTGNVDPTLANWTSSDPTIATVNANGLATALVRSAGAQASTTITATLKTDTTKTASAVLSVGDSTVGCTVPFPTGSVATKAISTLCDPVGALLGISVPLCGVDNPERVVDADPTTYARMFATVGLLFQSYESITVTAPTGTTFTASTAAPRRTGFIITNPVNDLVKADIVTQFSVTTLKAGVIQETTDGGTYFTLPGAPGPAYFPATSLPDPASALTVDLLGMRLNGGSSALVSINAKKDFDAIVLTLNAGLLSANSDRRVFSACSLATSPTP